MKEFIKNLLPAIKNYMGVDGLLHMLVCYAIVVTFGLIEYKAGIIIALGLSIFKECYDYSYRKQNPWDWEHTFHDLIFDAIGILLGVAVCLVLK